MVTRLSPAQWLERAHATHGDRFDYSAATYVKNTVNVTIICRVHGPFEQKPGSHTAGAIGCTGCKPVVVGRPATTTKAFIVRAREVYGDRFDYTATRYVNAKSAVLIGCGTHGQVPVLPRNFLHRPTGCPRCSRAALHSTAPKVPAPTAPEMAPEMAAVRARSGGRPQMSTADFIARARQVHGGDYDYAQTRYVDINTEVVIVCGIHGPFTQKPKNHLHNASGCTPCAHARRAAACRLTTAQFLEAAHATHGITYDYTYVVYVDSTTDVTIGCATHGQFSMKAQAHLSQRQGCPDCGRKRMTEGRRLSTEEFVARCRARHGDTFDYS